jgi:glycosyltransferase involved in cell wall biosynthesis
LDRCIQSLRSQKFSDWQCHVADDRSDDGSIETLFTSIRDDCRFKVSQNSERLFQLGTYQRILADVALADHDIIVSLDADDWLPDDGVLRRVRDAYADGNTWITYGSYKTSNDEWVFNKPLDDAALVRQVPWRTSHLRTWKLGLWRKIDPQDLLGIDGQPLRCAGDLAWMFPMIEMAGNAHSKWLESINYVYNRDNPLSCGKIRREEQFANARFLRQKPPYPALCGF